MSSLTYFGLWLAAGLVATGILSAWLARQWRLRERRRGQGLRMLEALGRYCEWLGLQRHAAQFQGEAAEAAQALDEACAIRVAWFPELAGDMAELLAMHNRMMRFLAAQQALRLRDAEAWLESDHDGRFGSLCRLQAYAIAAVRQKLRLDAVAPPPRRGAQAAYAGSRGA